MTERKTQAPGFFVMGAPLLLTALFVLMLVTFWQPLSMFVPNLMMG